MTNKTTQQDARQYEDSKERRIGKGGWEELHRSRHLWGRSWRVQRASTRVSRWR